MTETALNSTKPTALDYSASELNPDTSEAGAPHTGHGSEHSSNTDLSPRLPGALPVAELDLFARDYLLDYDYRMQLPRTIETRRIFIQNLP